MSEGMSGGKMSGAIMSEGMTKCFRFYSPGELSDGINLTEGINLSGGDAHPMQPFSLQAWSLHACLPSLFARTSKRSCTQSYFPGNEGERVDDNAILGTRDKFRPNCKRASSAPSLHGSKIAAPRAARYGIFA